MAKKTLLQDKWAQTFFLIWGTPEKTLEKRSKHVSEKKNLEKTIGSGETLEKTLEFFETETLEFAEKTLEKRSGWNGCLLLSRIVPAVFF